MFAESLRENKKKTEKIVDLQHYFERIRYHGSDEPTFQTLRDLHEAHVLAVPFENLDIHLGRTIMLDEAAFWSKIVDQRRGGFCYELNGLFALVLRAIGFRVDLLSAGVARSAGGFGPDYDHLTLLVHLEEDWLADVGFGEAFRQPLRLQSAIIQQQEMGRYRLEREGEDWIYQEWDGTWKTAYRFTLQPRTLAQFVERCRYQQTAPESHFTQQRVCSLATPTGRITLSDQRLITTIDGVPHERLLSDEEERMVLAEHFGIVFPFDASWQHPSA